MTLKYINGFETSRDDSDFRAQGWYFSPTVKYMAITPSFTGMSGTSLQLLSAPSASSIGAIGVAAASDPGYYNTGVTVNQAWTAGGFTFGFNARFNKGTAITYGISSVSQGCGNHNVCYDPVNGLYWAVQYNASAYALAKSPDLVNWTVVNTPALPAITTGVSYMGGGIVAFGITTSQTAVQIYWTSNNGNTWNLQALGTNTTASVVNMVGFGTGNSSFPHVIYTQTLGSGNQKMWVGTLGGTFTNVVNANLANSTCTGVVANIGGIALSTDGNTASFNCAWSANLSNASLNTSGAWNAITWSTYPGTVSDFAYNPVSNVYVLCSNNGIYTFANPGAAGTPTQLSAGAQTLTQRLSVGIYRIFWDAPTQKMVAFGGTGNIYTSSDSFTWTAQGQHINPVVTGYGNIYNAVYTGSQYALFDSSNGVISTTPDGVTNYVCQYVRDPAEAASGAYALTGVFSAPAFTSGTFSLTLGAGIWSAAASGGSRGLNFVTVNAGGSSAVMGTNTVTTTPLNHFYEMIATAIPGTTNSFLMNLYVDGVLAVTGSTAVAFAGTSDTTTVLGLTLGRSGQFVAWDDLYFCLNDGTGITGVQGPINIVARRPTTDVQAQWAKVGSAASNSLSVNQSALSSNSANYVTSSVAGDKDLYTSSTAIPANYRPLAVQLEAYAYKNSTTTPSMNIGLKSGSTESDSPTLSVTSTTPIYMSQIYQNDPNGNVAWTSTSVQNAEFVVNHVS